MVTGNRIGQYRDLNGLLLALHETNHCGAFSNFRHQCFTSLVSLLFMECKLHSGNLRPEALIGSYAKLKQDSDASRMQPCTESKGSSTS